MRTMAFCTAAFLSLNALAQEEKPQAKEDSGEARILFACQVWHNGPGGAKVVETADAYTALREKVTEISFPEGVRRADSVKLRELGEVDFDKHRVVLIWNTSMADEIRLAKADSAQIIVENVKTEANALQGSATMVVLQVARGEKAPRITWVGGAPKAARGGF